MHTYILINKLIILTMSMTRSRPVANAMAFGGEETGNMKEKEVVTATGNIR